MKVWRRAAGGRVAMKRGEVKVCGAVTADSVWSRGCDGRTE